jgi:hypothetical protein
MNTYNLHIEINGVGFDLSLEANTQKQAIDIALEKIIKETKVVEVNCKKGEQSFFGKLGSQIKTSLVL